MTGIAVPSTSPQAFGWDMQRATPEQEQEILQANEKLQAELLTEGERIYREGKFLETLESAFSEIWYQDSFILKTVALVTVSARVSNIHSPIHVHVMGSPQSGKSDGVKAALTLMDPRVVAQFSFSAQALFYDDQLPEGSTIFHDEKPGPSAIETLRPVLTDWFSGSKRKTVSVDRKVRILTIPARTTLILASADGLHEDDDAGQDESRFLIFDIRRDDFFLDKICEWIQQPHPDISRARMLIHKIWSVVPAGPVTVHKPLPRQSRTIREFKRFLAMIQCHALLSGRTTTTDEDIDAIEKLLTYTRPMLSQDTPGLTPREKAVFDSLPTDKGKAINAREITEIIKIPKASVHKALAGSGTYERPTGGLQSKRINGTLVMARRDYDEITKSAEWVFWRGQ